MAASWNALGLADGTASRLRGHFSEGRWHLLAALLLEMAAHDTSGTLQFCTAVKLISEVAVSGLDLQHMATSQTNIWEEAKHG